MLILGIETSCDETCAAVTEGTTVLANVIWSQASEHARFGGVVPSLAQRQHEERIDWVVDRALRQAQCRSADILAFAVTAGPGLAIALGVGIAKAGELATQLGKPLVAVNHVEGHILSPLARAMTKSQFPNLNISFPALALVVSGGHTELIRVEAIGKYKVLAKTADDALGEALDKAARMLGLGYPGGAVLEKMAREGDPKRYPLPLPMAGREDRGEFSYSGLKAAFFRLVAAEERNMDKQKVCDLAACFQARAFEHLVRVMRTGLRAKGEVLRERDLLVGGGVAANIELRKRLRKLCRELGLNLRLPYSARLCGDNAAMVGIAAYHKAMRGEFIEADKIDRRPGWRIDET